MYEFHYDRWDQTDPRSANQRNEGRGETRAALSEGWLIQRIVGDGETGNCDDHARYLQIGTGQWCSAAYATLFPMRSTALIYAREFGYVVGRNVKIVRHRF